MATLNAQAPTDYSNKYGSTHPNLSSWAWRVKISFLYFIVQATSFYTDHRHEVVIALQWQQKMIVFFLQLAAHPPPHTNKS
jgi:hypothetical protein